MTYSDAEGKQESLSLLEVTHQVCYHGRHDIYGSEGRKVSRIAPAGVPKIAENTGAQRESPPLFKVLMHNDDYTTMEFVVEVLESVFHKSSPEANRIMINIHVRGIGYCGTYPFEIAETKVVKVHGLARAEGFPLKCTLEEA
jgi:ATP-dependent Clp protease adaptor protein ClpS